MKEKDIYIYIFFFILPIKKIYIYIFLFPINKMFRTKKHDLNMSRMQEKKFEYK